MRLATLVTGAAGNGAQSALHPAGVNAARIRDLLGAYTGVAAVVFVLVVGCALFALARRRARPGEDMAPQRHPAPARERRTVRIVESLSVLTALTLLGLTLADFRTRHAMAALDARQELTVKVTGHQWWWDFEYQDARPDRIVTSPNELHLPVGRVVRFDLAAHDVIHSFWIPTLHGKKDLLPGESSSTTLRPDRVGTYYGQCAEFCGMQHATMRFVVVVEPPDRFARWLDAQRAPAAEPATASTQRGRALFLGGPCVLCHAVSGTPAAARLGPDLSHVGGRLALASAALPNTRDHLTRWVGDAPGTRPGVMMPPTAMSPRDVDDLVNYLASLK